MRFTHNDTSSILMSHMKVIKICQKHMISILMSHMKVIKLTKTSFMNILRIFDDHHM